MYVEELRMVVVLGRGVNISAIVSSGERSGFIDERIVWRFLCIEEEELFWRDFLLLLRQ